MMQLLFNPIIPDGMGEGYFKFGMEV